MISNGKETSRSFQIGSTHFQVVYSLAGMIRISQNVKDPKIHRWLIVPKRIYRNGKNYSLENQREEQEVYDLIAQQGRAIAGQVFIGRKREYAFAMPAKVPVVCTYGDDESADFQFGVVILSGEAVKAIMLTAYSFGMAGSTLEYTPDGRLRNIFCLARKLNEVVSFLNGEPYDYLVAT